MKILRSVEELQAVYGVPIGKRAEKPHDRITPKFRTWIDAARFAIISTVGGDGTDISPRGDNGPVVRVVDQKTIMLPDWRGNNRLDSLHNIIRDPRVSIMFMINGQDIVIAINGTAKITVDEELCASFAKLNKYPKTVLIIRVDEIYLQCSKAIMRSELWKPQNLKLPTAGELWQEQDPNIDPDEYDERIRKMFAQIIWQ